MTPPEQPEPRMFTPTVAKPSALAISVRRLRVVGIGDRVAGVLDHGRERPVGQRPSERRADHRGEQRAVAGLDVVEALAQGLRLVEGLVRMVLEAEHRHRDGLAAGDVAHDVAAAGLELAEDQAAEAVGRPAADLAAAAVLEGEQGALDGELVTGDDVDASAHLERGRKGLPRDRDRGARSRTQGEPGAAGSASRGDVRGGTLPLST